MITGLKTKIVKQFSFDASHQLPQHSGQCARLHGHTYKVELELTGEVKPVDGRSDGGMIVDFGDVKKAFEATCGFLDHRFLCPLRNRDVNVLHAENEFVTIQYLNTGQELCLPRSNVAFVDVENTTAELLAAFIYERLIFLVPELTAVRVWETPTAFAEVRP